MALDPNRWTLKTQEAVSTPPSSRRAPAQQPRGHPRPPARRPAPPGGRRRPARSCSKVGAGPAHAAQPGRRGAWPSCPRPTAARAPHQPRADRRVRRGRRPPARSSATSTSRPSTCCWPWPTGSGVEPRGPARPRSGEVRGSHRVTSQNPEEQYQALEKYGRDLTEAAARGQARPGHRPRRGDPPGHPGAVAAAPRTTRCSSASPASARPPSSRASPGASSRATCPRA